MIRQIRQEDLNALCGAIRDLRLVILSLHSTDSTDSINRAFDGATKDIAAIVEKSASPRFDRNRFLALCGVKP